MANYLKVNSWDHASPGFVEIYQENTYISFESVFWVQLFYQNCWNTRRELASNPMGPLPGRSVVMVKGLRVGWWEREREMFSYPGWNALVQQSKTGPSLESDFWCPFFNAWKMTDPNGHFLGYEGQRGKKRLPRCHRHRPLSRRAREGHRRTGIFILESMRGPGLWF